MQQLIGTSSTAEGRAVKNVMKKLNNCEGFTLAETLMTVLILVMVAGVVAGGIPAAVRVRQPGGLREYGMRSAGPLAEGCA